MAIKTSKLDRLTEAQQKELVQRCNDAYDKGGSDVLKILVDIVFSLQEQNKDDSNFVAGMKIFLTIIEGLRQKLYEAVKQAEPEESKIISL